FVILNSHFCYFHIITSRIHIALRNYKATNDIALFETGAIIPTASQVEH
ncbi:unnamed protein product, partial [marine sediment metagenome]